MELKEKKKILIICYGNSCRSQMAEGFALNMGWQAFSAGTQPELAVNPFAVNVMLELGIDISHHKPQSVNEYLDEKFYLVATVCNNALKDCPIFPRTSTYQIHYGFVDPADASGNKEEITDVYRQVRDDIQIWIEKLRRDYL